MQQSILTRYIALSVFLFTCCLTVDVNARERDLGNRPAKKSKTTLTPEALQLLSDANALLEGFTPAKVTPFELTPRRKVKKTLPVKMANSRVKVKFADELQIRLDVHNQLYSKTGRTSSAIADLVSALGVTLSPVHTDSQASIDALIRRAELHSGKQQPDLSGTYWVDGDQSVVDVAAELFYTMEEVEWVMYNPLLIRPTGPISDPEVSATKPTDKKNNKIQAKAQSLTPVFGACWFGKNDCESNLEKYDCIDFGGTFLGNNSICPENKTTQPNKAYARNADTQWCDSYLSPDDKERMLRMLDDGTWDSYRSGKNNNALRGGNIVNMTVHIVRNTDGTGGVNEQAVIDVVDTHNITAAATGLTWCITGNFVYHDSDALVAQAANGAQITEGFVDNTINVYCSPALLPGVAGFACFPPSTCFSLANSAIDTDLGSFSHEMGHYFNLLHTFDNDLGDECVDGSNCAIAGDVICDTPADPSALTGGPEYDPLACLYTGVTLDACGSGDPYDPLMNNLMSYFSGCRTAFTTEQINVISAIAADERSNLVTVTCNDVPVQLGACCMGDTSCVENQTQTDCNNAGGIYQGANIACGDVNCEDPGPDLLVAVCCLYDADSGAGPGCVDISGDDCIAINGIYMPAEEPDEGETICEIFTDCPEDQGPNPYPTSCGEFGEYTTYFAGDCYIDQTKCAQDNRPLGQMDNTPGCLDTPETIINGNYVVVTNAPDGPDTTFLDQSCCTNVMDSVPWCATNPWDALCASAAISYAVEGDKGCQREIQEDDQITCSAAFGSAQGRSRQPVVLAAYVGSNLNVVYDLPTAVTVQYEIIEDGGRYMNLYFDGAMEQQNLSGQSISQIGTWIELTSETYGVSLTAACCAWTGCCQGEDPPNDYCEEELANVCESSATWLATLPMTTLEDDTHLYASFISSAGAACTAYAGSPSIPHVVPGPGSGPDFAEIGLLTWMTPDMIPNIDPQYQNRKPLPSSVNLLTANEVLQAQQLMPWPIGGFSGTAVCSEGQAPPVLSPGGTINWGGEGLDLFPDPGNPGGFGQSDVYKGAYGYGQKWADEDGDPNIVNGAFGNNVKVAVLDWSAHLQATTNDVGIDMGGIHAELTHVVLEGVDTGHDPVELIFDENLTNQWYPFSADHGTGVLGIIGAQWGPNSAPGASIETRLANNVGVLGMVPDADMYFFPLATVQDPTGRQETAWIHALATLGAGDVICAAYRPVVSNETWPNLNFLADMNSYLELANNLGICTVIAAGNNGVDLGSIEPEGGDQGAIVATSVSPGRPYKRWCTGSSASNYTTLGSYETVTASGWGMGVATCGKGPNRDNFLGYSTCVYDDPTNAHDVHAYAYTNNFDNTGAAAATVAGAVAIVEGFTRQIFEVPMSPTVMRQLIAGGRYEGVDREGNPIMPFRDYTSEDNSSECELPEPNPLDWDNCAPLETGWRTGSLVDPLEAMRNTIYDPIFDTPNIESLLILRGTYHLGNIYSLAGDDGNLFGVSGVSTGANVQYAIPAEVPGDYVRYPSAGNVTDIYLTGELETTLPANNELTVEINFEETQPDQFYLRCEMWDYRRRSWEQASATTVVVNGTEDVDLTIESASRFIDRTTTQYHLRLTTAVTNLPGSGSQPPYPIMYDQILVKTGLTQVPRP